jgi:hypothetical protein
MFLWNYGMTVKSQNTVFQEMKNFTQLSSISLSLRMGYIASRETSQVGRLPAPGYLPSVKVCLPEIRSKSGWKKFLISVR